MALARVYDAKLKAITVTLAAGYRDRLSKASDITEYLPYLYNQAESRPGVRVLELGCRRGNSTLAFLAGAAESGGHVWSSDLADCDWDPDGMLPWRRSRLWTFIKGDDMDEETQTQLPAEVDVLFIDTSHEYEHTLAELHAYIPRVAPGGVALFHDTNLFAWPGYQPPGKFPPVWQALDDYCRETGLTWENRPGSYGLGVIQVGSQREAA